MIGKPENHLQTMNTFSTRKAAGDIKVPTRAMAPLPLDERQDHRAAGGDGA